VKLSRNRIRQLILESIRGKDSPYKYIHEKSFELIKPITSVSLKTNPYVGLTQELALKFYSENPGRDKPIYFENRREIGGNTRGMNKLTYRPRWGDPVLIRIGTDEKGDGIFMQKKPLVSTSEANSSWSGSIYLIFGDYENWETKEVISGQFVTQNPQIYDNIPEENKNIIDSGVYVEDAYYSKNSSARRASQTYNPCLLDRHLTEIYEKAGLIQKAESPDDLIKTLFIVNELNYCTLKELQDRLNSLARQDNTLNSLYAQHILARIETLKNKKD